MFCNQCGKELPEDVIFCPHCGTKREDQPVVDAAQPMTAAAQPVAAPVQEVKKEKKKSQPFKILIPIGVVFVLLVVLLVIFLVGGSKKGAYELVADQGISRYRFDEETIFWNKDCGSEVVEDVDRVYISGDDSAVFYMLDDGSAYYMDTELKSTFITEDVESAVQSFSGDYIGYVDDIDESGVAGTLYLYDTKNKKSIEIDDDVYPYSLCLSPSGKTIAYLKNYEDDEDNDLYIGGINRESEKIDHDGCVPIGISDNGKNFYYVNSNWRLYYYNGKEAEKIETDVENSDTFFFNKDLTELVYSKNGNSYFFSTKNEDPVKISSRELHGLTMDDEEAYQWSSNYGVVLGRKTLRGSVFMSDSNCYWLNEDGTDTVRVSSGDITSSAAYQLSSDGKSMLYCSYGVLYKVVFGEEMETEELYSEENVLYFVSSRDLSTIYFVNEDYELYYLKGKDKKEKISIDIENTSSQIAYCEEENKVYYIEDGDLYSAKKNSKSKEKVAEDIERVTAIHGGILYAVIDEFTQELYYLP